MRRIRARRGRPRVERRALLALGEDHRAFGMLIDDVGRRRDEAGLLGEQRLGEDRRRHVAELAMLADRLDGHLADAEVLALRERAKRSLALAGERTAQQRGEARALRDLRGLGVALAEDLRVVGSAREAERRRATQLGKTTRERGLRLRRRRHRGERTEHRLCLLRRLCAERPDQRVEYMKFGPEQALDRHRVLVGGEPPERLGGRELAWLEQRAERACGLGALRRRRVLVDDDTEQRRRRIAREVLARAADGLDGEDPRVAGTREGEGRHLEDALGEGLAGVRARERVEGQVRRAGGATARVGDGRRERLEERGHRVGADLLPGAREITEAEERRLLPRASCLEERDERLLGEAPAAPTDGARDRGARLDLRGAAHSRADAGASVASVRSGAGGEHLHRRVLAPLARVAEAVRGPGDDLGILVGEMRDEAVHARRVRDASEGSRAAAARDHVVARSRLGRHVLRAAQVLGASDGESIECAARRPSRSPPARRP